MKTPKLPEYFIKDYFFFEVVEFSKIIYFIFDYGFTRSIRNHKTTLKSYKFSGPMSIYKIWKKINSMTIKTGLLSAYRLSDFMKKKLIQQYLSKHIEHQL